MFGDREIPSEFKMPVQDQRGNILVANLGPGRLNPIFGTINGQFVKFFVLHVYNERKSKELGFEYLDEVEMCHVVNDNLCKADIRVKDLARWQREQWAQLYDHFKRQVQQGGTLVENWLAINEHQRALLLHCNIMSVEQILELNDDAKGRLGPEGPELFKKAKEHLKVKEEKVKSSELAQELLNIRTELEAQSKKHKEEIEAMFKRHEAAALPSKPKARPGRKPKPLESIEA